MGKFFLSLIGNVGLRLSSPQRSTWLPAFEITEIARTVCRRSNPRGVSWKCVGVFFVLFILSCFVLKGGGGRESAQVSFCL